MQRYNINNRLAYLSGGVQSAGGMWPSVAAADWWDVAGETCVAAYQPKGAASLAASYTNLANPGTYDAAPGTAPTWDATNGWKFASSQYLTTGLYPAAAWSVIVRFTNRDLAGDIVGATTTANNRFSYTGISSGGGLMYFAYGSQGSQSVSFSDTSGVLANGAQYMRFNKAALMTSTGTWGDPTTTYPVYIAARNNNSTAERFATIYIQAMAFYSTTLDATQLDDLTDAMNAL